MAAAAAAYARKSAALESEQPIEGRFVSDYLTVGFGVDFYAQSATTQIVRCITNSSMLPIDPLEDSTLKLHINQAAGPFQATGSLVAFM